MTAVRTLLALLATSLAMAPPCLAAAASVQTDSSSVPARILSLHNRERAAVGSPPMVWDPALAASAASYGPTLARLGRLVHSPRETRAGQRENLAMGSAGYRVEELVGFWIEEKRHFQPGLFPYVSRTGQWADVAHYTQMVWKGTTNVGCALYGDGHRNYLICRYSPPGNADGRPVY